MSTQNEKSSAFLEAINKYAEQQRGEMQSEVEAFKEKELKKAEEEVLKDSYKLIQKEIADMRKKIKSELSKKEINLKNKLFEQRKEITDEVFKKAYAKLLDFTNTDAYQDSLKKCLSNIRAVINKGKTILYIANKDIKHTDLIKQEFSGDCEVKESKDIKIGGIRAVNEEMGLIADETLDSKLDQQREWFEINSKLTIV